MEITMKHDLWTLWMSTQVNSQLQNGINYEDTPPYQTKAQFKGLDKYYSNIVYEQIIDTANDENAAVTTLTMDVEDEIVPLNWVYRMFIDTSSIKMRLKLASLNVSIHGLLKS